MLHIIKEFLKIGFFIEFITLMILPLSVFAPQSITILLYFLAAVFLYDLTQKGLLKTILFSSISTPLVIAVFALPLLGSLSACWSLAPYQSVLCSLRLFLLNASGFIVVKGITLSTHQPKIIRGLILGFLLTLVLLSFEILSNGALASAVRGYSIRMFKYNKSICLVILMSPVVLQFLPTLSTMTLFKFFKRNFCRYLVVGIIGVVVFNLEIDACKISYIIGILLFIIFSVLSLKATQRILVFLVVACFISPFTLTKMYYNSTLCQNFTHQVIRKHSAYDRLSIWNYTQDIIFNQTPSHFTSLLHFIGGFGMNTSKLDVFRLKDRCWSVPDFNIPQNQLQDHPEKVFDYRSEGIPLHPHNFILQIFLELGCLGLALASIILYLTIKEFRQLSFSSMSQKLIGVTFTTGLIISSISFGFWQSWWISTLWLVVSTTQLLRQQPASLFR